MVIALDASSPAGVYANTAALTAITTASFTPPAGSIIVAKVYTGDAQCVAGTPTGTGLTFTTWVNDGVQAASSTRLLIATAVGNGTATTVSTGAFTTSG